MLLGALMVMIVIVVVAIIFINGSMAEMMEAQKAAQGI
jgi:hypothetical protein